MKVFFWGIGLFVLVFAVHLVIWRIRIPSAGRRFLFGLFLGALPVCLGAVHLAHDLNPLLVRLAPSGLPAHLFIGVVYLSISLAYLALYVPIEGDSPSLSMIHLVDSSGHRGVSPEELERAMMLERHLRSRVQLLLVDGMAELEGETYRITPKGRRLLKYYALYGKLAGSGEKSI